MEANTFFLFTLPLVLAPLRIVRSFHTFKVDASLDVFFRGGFAHCFFNRYRLGPWWYPGGAANTVCGTREGVDMFPLCRRVRYQSFIAVHVTAVNTLTARVIRSVFWPFITAKLAAFMQDWYLRSRCLQKILGLVRTTACCPRHLLLIHDTQAGVGKAFAKSLKMSQLFSLLLYCLRMPCFWGFPDGCCS